MSPWQSPIVDHHPPPSLPSTQHTHPSGHPAAAAAAAVLPFVSSTQSLRSLLFSVHSLTSFYRVLREPFDRLWAPSTHSFSFSPHPRSLLPAWPYLTHSYLPTLTLTYPFSSSTPFILFFCPPVDPNLQLGFSAPPPLWRRRPIANSPHDSSAVQPRRRRQLSCDYLFSDDPRLAARTRKTPDRSTRLALVPVFSSVSDARLVMNSCTRIRHRPRRRL